MSNSNIKQNGHPKVLYFTAKWCGPCKKISPYFEKFSSEYPKIKFYKIDVDENQELAERYQISSIPTFIFEYLIDSSKFVHFDSLSGADHIKLESRIKKLDSLISGSPV
jgi:thioredoxin